MEKAVGQFVGLAGAGVVVLFCILMLQGALPMAGRLVAYAQEDVEESQNKGRLEQILNHEIPEDMYVGRVMEPGKWTFWEDCLSETEGEMGAKEKVSLYFLDLLGPNGERVSAESYQEEKRELMFSDTGIYTLRFRIFGSYGRSSIQEVRIPVEGA